jgi:hypothetical protein
VAVTFRTDSLSGPGIVTLGDSAFERVTVIELQLELRPYYIISYHIKVELEEVELLARALWGHCWHPLFQVVHSPT